MKRVRELEGVELDYWVARAAGHSAIIVFGVIHVSAQQVPFSPSSEWGHGGPIIERERISVMRYSRFPGDLAWGASASPDAEAMTGDTILIAAMRCYVASKFGDEVEDVTG